MSDYVMTIGKYKGQRLEYKDYLCRHQIYIRPELKGLCQALIDLQLRKPECIRYFDKPHEHFPPYPSAYVMEFGEFKGKKIFNVPQRYLKWCVKARVYKKRALFRAALVKIGLK